MMKWQWKPVLCLLLPALALFLSVEAVRAQDSENGAAKTSVDEAEVPDSAFAGEIGSGRIQVTLVWDNIDDMDVEVREPNGTRIYWNNRGPTATGGRLDRDGYATCEGPGPAVENIYWPASASPQEGLYTVYVKLYESCTASVADWALVVTVDGQVVVDEQGTTEASFTFRLGPQVEIMHVETAQVVQNEPNSVPLVAGKPTLVRVYVNCQLPCPNGGVTGVSGVIKIGTTSISSYNSSVTVQRLVDWRTVRNVMSRTVNFYLPPQFTQGTVSMNIEIYVSSGSRRRLDDTVSRTLTFNQTRRLSVLSVPINYVQNQTTSSPPEWILGAHLWTETVYPISSLNYVEHSGSITYSGDLSQDEAQIELGQQVNRVLAGTSHTNAVGWLPVNAVTGNLNGWQVSGTPSTVVVTRNLDVSQTTLAHELGHAYGLDHVPPGNPTACGQAKIGQPGYEANGTGWSLYGADTYNDIMSYCFPRWLSPASYQHLYGMLSSGAPQPPNNAQAVGSYYLISGLVFTNDTVELDPVVVIESGNPRLPQAGSQYCVQVRNAQNSVLSQHCFNLEFYNEAEERPRDVDSFLVMLPYNAAAKSIVLRKGGQNLVTRTFSANTPTVTVLSPNGGENWQANGTYNIAWTGNDTDGDTLTYSVFYSPNGASWQPLALDLTGTTLQVRAANLPGGANARIRVLASDGANTGSDESNASFRVQQHAPVVTILQPARAITLQRGAVIAFEATGYDVEDGTLEAGAFRWSSSLNGVLGTGNLLVTSNLSLGEHIITVRATDSSGRRRTASIRVTVVPPAPPRNAPRLLSPGNGGGVTTNSITFNWQAVSNANSYQIQIDNNADFSSPERALNVNATSYTTNLLVNRTFYWRVRGRNAIGNGPWSRVFRFRLDTVPPRATTATAPTCNTTVTNLQPVFRWRSIAGVARYELELDTVNPPVNRIFTRNVAYQPQAPLLETVYHWRVRTVDAAGNTSGWTPLCTLTIVAQQGAAPSQNAVSTATPTLKWGAVSWSKAYQVQVSRNSAFTSIVFAAQTSASTLQATTTTLAEGVYFWRVRARREDNTWGTWSTPDTISINLP